MEDLAKLTKEEEEILMLTEEIWNRFLALPINHPMEANEIAMKIHDIQRMIISRPGFRMNKEKFRDYGEVKRWWLPNLQMWYVFFYRKNGGKVRGVLGRERTNDLLGSIL